MQSILCSSRVLQGSICDRGPHFGVCSVQRAPRQRNQRSGERTRCKASKGGKGDRKRPSSQPEQAEPLTAPIISRVQKQLTAVDRAQAPVWSTFCGVSSGDWRGQFAAFNPETGAAEAVGLAAGEGGRRGPPVYLLQTVSVEERIVEDGRDEVVRQVWRAPLESELAAAAADIVRSGSSSEGEGSSSSEGEGGSGSSSSGGEGSAREGGAGGTFGAAGGLQPDRVETLKSDDQGLVIFDGGSYSAGPAVIGSLWPRGNDAEEADAWQQYGQVHSTHVPAAADSAAARHLAVGLRTGDDGDTALPEYARVPGLRLPPNGGAAGEGSEEGEYDSDAEYYVDGDDDGEAGGDDGDYVDEEGELAPRNPAELEFCLMVGGEERMRVQVTLSVAGGLDGSELDVEVMRVAVLQETWEGEVGGWTSGRIFDRQRDVVPLTDQPMLTPSALQHEWTVFDVFATPIMEQDPLTGEESKVWVYSSQETRQRWKLAGGSSLEEEEGGVLWLPGRMALELKMLEAGFASAAGPQPGLADKQISAAAVAAGPSAHGGEGGGGGFGFAPNRGLLMSVFHQTREGQVIAVQREYSPQGLLQEVRSRTAVKGSWVGGRM